MPKQLITLEIEVPEGMEFEERATIGYSVDGDWVITQRGTAHKVDYASGYVQFLLAPKARLVDQFPEWLNKGFVFTRGRHWWISQNPPFIEDEIWGHPQEANLTKVFRAIGCDALPLPDDDVCFNMATRTEVGP